MSEAQAFNKPTTNDLLKEGKLEPRENFWTRLSQAIWGSNTREQYRESTSEEMAQALIAAGLDPTDKCLPLVRLYDSAEEAKIAACRASRMGGPKDPPMP